MKTLYTLLFLTASLICASDSTAQMRMIFADYGDENNHVQKFSFYSPSEGYVAFSRYIGYTTDSGRTFSQKTIRLNNVDFNGYPVNLTFGFGINGVKALNRDTILVYGDYGFVPAILISTDRGDSYKVVYHDRYDAFTFKVGITDMIFPQNNNIGYAVQADRIIKTTDRGVSWSVVNIDAGRHFDRIEAVDNNNVFAFGTEKGSSKLLKTSNGINWTDVVIPPGKMGSVFFLTAAKGWLTLQNDDQQGEVYYTSNGGASWTLKNDPEITSFASAKMHFINDSTGFAKSAMYYVFKTTDSGKIWQPLPRDNVYNYLLYGHIDMQVLNPNQLWAGGGHGLIEINTNAAGPASPAAYFKVDTNGLRNTGTVKLVNYSKPNYQYRWYKNDTLFSTSYHASFTHNLYWYRDTIKLVVSDGARSDSLEKYIDYPKVWINSFTPATAGQGNTVTIYGFNFSSTFEVRFGGVRARSYTVISNTEIRAVLDGGSSGNVEVFTMDGPAALGGFTFLGTPVKDLPTTISDTILCKSERVTVTINNTETGVMYELVQWGWGAQVVGGAPGNGGTISFLTSPISENSQFIVLASRIGSQGATYFSTFINIRVEHTRARFTADQLNITAGEAVTYAAQNGESQTYHWTLYQDASISSATGTKTPAITYGSTGQKTLRLIAVSQNGCRDTVTGNAIYIYTKPAVDASCYLTPLDSANTKGMVLTKVVNSHDDGTLVIGATDDATKLRSKIGVAKEFAAGNHGFFAKYNSDGVLKWVHYFKPGAGGFTAINIDTQGNIYLTGYAETTEWLYWSNGDSTQLYAMPTDTTYLGNRRVGFIMKLDRDGKHLWHTLLYDHTVLWQGYPSDATGEHIAIKDDHIIIIGGFYQRISYARNGIIKPLYDGFPRGNVHTNHVILKIKPDGTLLWNALMYFEANNYHYLSDVAVDKNGNTTLAGTYEYIVKVFDADSVERVNFRNPDRHRGILVRLDSNGAVKWYNNFVHTGQYSQAGLERVVADDAGNTYVTGSMSGGNITITHNDGTVLSDSAGAFALYKFDANGKRKWGVGTRYPYYGWSTALYLKGNEIYAVGNAMNNGPEISSFNMSSTDGNNRTLMINRGEIYIAKYDTAGVFKRVYTSGFNVWVMDQSATSLYTNSKGQFILAGNARTGMGGVIKSVFNVDWPGQLDFLADGFFMKMQPDFCLAAVTADAGPDKISCENDTVSLGSTASGDYYSWTSNPAGFTSSLSNPIPRPKVNTTYYLKVTTEEGATAYDTVSITLKPAPFVDAGPDTTVCSTQEVWLGTPAIAGITYRWHTYDGPFGPGQAQIPVYPYSETIYYLKAVAPNNCPAWDTVVVKTIPNGTPFVQIKKPLGTICEGDTVVFTSITEWVGDAPVYQWKLRDVNVGGNTSTYKTDSLKNGDWLSLYVIHNNACMLSQPVASTGITPVTVLDKLDPSVTIAGNNTVNEGEFTQISSTLSEAGTSFAIKWQDSTSNHTWRDLSQTGPTYNYKPTKTGDKIRCVVTVTNALCISNTVVYSAGISFIVNKVTGIDPVPAARYGLRYYPNPTHSILILDSLRLQDQWQELQITSIDGKQTYLRMNINNRVRIDVAVARLSPGMHVAVLRNRKGEAVYLKFVKL